MNDGTNEPTLIEGLAELRAEMASFREQEKSRVASRTWSNKNLDEPVVPITRAQLGIIKAGAPQNRYRSVGELLLGVGLSGIVTVILTLVSLKSLPAADGLGLVASFVVAGLVFGPLIAGVILLVIGNREGAESYYDVVLGEVEGMFDV